MPNIVFIQTTHRDAFKSTCHYKHLCLRCRCIQLYLTSIKHMDDVIKLIYNGVNYQCRQRILRITNTRFQRKLIQNNINLMPMVVFNDNKYWIEHVWIVDILKRLSIAISIKLESATNTGKVT